MKDLTSFTSNTNVKEEIRERGGEGGAVGQPTNTPILALPFHYTTIRPNDLDECPFRRYHEDKREGKFAYYCILKHMWLMPSEVETLCKNRSECPWFKTYGRVLMKVTTERKTMSQEE